MRAADREEVERLLERAVADAGPRTPAGTADLLAEGREHLAAIADTAAREYAAYRRALGAARPAAPPRAVGVIGLAAGVSAGAAFAMDLGLGLSAGAALATGVVVGVTGGAVHAVAGARRGRADAAAPGGPAQARLLWLAAVERRGIRPFLETREAHSPAAPPSAPSPAPEARRPDAPHVAAPSSSGPAADPQQAGKQAGKASGKAPASPGIPPQRRTGDRSAAARARAVLEQSFGQLPEYRGPFTGRREHLAQIAQWVHQARASTAVRPTVVVLHGPSGSGRTALAVRAAQQLKDQFRGACVVDLRGADAPLPARDALLHLLNRLGAPRDQLLFRDRQDRQDHGQHLRRLSEQYQKHLTDVPVIIVLDEATTAEQVRTVVPERSESLVLVTAREPFDLELPGARTHFLEVGPLDPDGAFELLGDLAEAAGEPGPRPEEAERLRVLCGGLPIALRVAGAALSDHGGAARLAADIEVFGPRDPVDRVLALRYHDQPEPNRRLLRRLALAGRASFGAAAAAALLATDEQEAARRLAELAAAGLVDNVRGNRYRPHELVRRFAGERLQDEEDPVERAAAHERLIRSYADLANTVIRLVEGKTSTRAGRFGQHGFPSLDQALRWLDEESSFITGALRNVEGVDRAAVQALLGALCDYCLLRGDLYRLGEISEMAQAQQARQQGTGRPGEDRSVLVRSVQWRTGIAARQLGELDKARSTLTSVVDLYFEAEHPAGAARALNSLGITLHHQGNLREAEAKLREALAIQGASPELDEDRAWTLHALGAVLRDTDRLEEALALLRESLVLHRANESVQGEAWAHLQLGQSYLRLGRVAEGEAELRAAGQAYALARDPRGSAWTLTQLARTRLLRGAAEDAARDLDEAVQRHRGNDDARGEAWTLYYLGQALEECGDGDSALRVLERSRSMFSRMRDVYGLACARHHSARVTRDLRAARTGNLRNSGFARQLLQDARQDFRRIGVEHGEAWSCVELAVIDAGNERLLEALTLLEEAEGLFSGIGDVRGRDWTVFLRATILPLLAADRDSAGGTGTAYPPEVAEQARESLRALAAGSHPGQDPDLAEYAAAYALLLERDSVVPGGPWDAWRLGMTPGRSARMTLAFPAGEADRGA
ncbi:tetratricopeptide repeat protein [Streptomyces sp. PLK6-54]|uniref:Tetratricopeptide repeat protein n=1 Tax=Actinacidiphila acidipaludis TaxID=2873382 RepID=A0ABS7Q202_9ACTN|nr:tetratricopeptide repeat protein [Streptomyces acidipaludis]MBY8877153.1 tetratricopeptide repeat protein [Streptomyces acidipaludis]